MNLPCKLLACCSMALLFQGCIAPTPPVLPTPKPLEAHLDPWWQELHDTHLTTLANTVISENLSLQMAQQRVLQAYATLENKKASNFPSASLSGAKAHQDELRGVESKKESYTATLSASYEVDLFGKRSDTIEAQNALFRSTQEALHVTGISLVAELANAWYSLGYKQESLALLEEQFKVAHTILTLTQLSRQNGTNSITDVWQQEQYIKNLEAQKITLIGDIETQKRAINLLLGRSALDTLDVAKEAKLIALPPQPDVGIPASKLLARPDVRQAFFTLESSNYSLSEAIKNQYPSLNLSLNTVASATHFSNLLDTIIATATATLGGTLFDAGAKEDLVKKALFLSKESSLAYKQTLLEAFKEVQDALENEKTHTLYLHHLDERIALAKVILERQQAKYRFGMVGYLGVLNAQESLQELEQTRLSKQLDLLKYRIALHRSLAGGMMEYDVINEWRKYDR
jgi:outer membrane protein, multidrug efflux system